MAADDIHPFAAASSHPHDETLAPARPGEAFRALFAWQAQRSPAESLLMQLRDLERELEGLPLPQQAPQALPAVAAIDQAAAQAAGFRIRHAGELTVIKGLGPQAEKMLRHAGIRSLHDLAAHPDSQLQRMFQLASPRLRRIRPRQWQAQARLAASNRWAQLRQLQDSLRGPAATDANPPR